MAECDLLALNLGSNEARAMRSAWQMPLNGTPSPPPQTSASGLKWLALLPPPCRA